MSQPVCPARPMSVLTLLALLCGGAAAATDRPQTPRPPFPYRTVEVAIFGATDGDRLSGSLCLPPSEAPVPAVVLLGVAGPNDRDLGFAGHRAFAVWADHLCREGVAVLRWDDRGVGASGGDWRQAGYEVLAPPERCPPPIARWYDRTQQHAAKHRGATVSDTAFATTYRLELAPMPCWRHLPPETVRRNVAGETLLHHDLARSRKRRKLSWRHFSARPSASSMLRCR
jgi:hypothetical protein